MATKRQKKQQEQARNFFLVALAVGLVVIFFNLDIIKEGDSVFSRNFERKIKFSGDLGRDSYTEKEISRLLKHVKKHDDLYEKIIIRTTKQDSYKAIKPTTQVLFEVKITMVDGTSVTTPTIRCQRKVLAGKIITKLNKDLRAYKELKDKGTKVDSLVNTM